jgi:hypothetical protein
MSRDCLPSIPKPRKRQSINGLSEPEIRGAPLSHILDSTTSPLHTTSSHSPVHTHPGHDRRSDEPRDGVEFKADAVQSSSRSFVSLFVHSLGLDDYAQSSFDSLSDIDYAFVQDKFAAFERMANRSPFVELPSFGDLIMMIAKRPVTSLAICTVTTTSNTELRHRLVRTFRRTISTKCILDDERSVDLMSGLFIHTMWHHRYMHKQQIYQYLHLLTGMASEQGLHRYFGLDTLSSRQSDREVQLLFLGCYYLCTTLAGFASDRPSPFPWSDHLSNVALRFSFRGPFPSNSNTVNLIELGRYLGDADTTMRRSSEALDTSAHNRAWSIWHNSEAELRRLKGLIHKFTSITPHPDMQATTIAVSSIVLQNSKHVQTRLLTDMAIGIKDYFDIIFAEPPASIFYFSIIDWTHLLSVIAILMLILNPRFEKWEAVPGALRNLLEPEVLLDTVVARMSAVPAHERHDELLHWFADLTAKIKMKWQRDKLPRPRTGSGDVSETEARFRPVNAGMYSGDRSRGSEPQGPMGGLGVCDVDIGRVCKLDLLEDAFWERLLQS